MLKFLINTVLLSLLYALMGLFVGDQIHLGYVVIAVTSAAICTPGPWFSLGPQYVAVSRDEALQWCGEELDRWPEHGPLPIPLRVGLG